VIDKITGPSYTDVANRYQPTPEVIDTLVTKIIEGGSGRWGTQVMNAHPNLSREDAQLMVKYVLSLKQ
jgi:cytochrome c